MVRKSGRIPLGESREELTPYQAERRKLLEAAGWNGYAARRGTNQDEARAARRANQLALNELRRSRHGHAA